MIQATRVLSNFELDCSLQLGRVQFFTLIWDGVTHRIVPFISIGGDVRKKAVAQTPFMHDSMQQIVLSPLQADGILQQLHSSPLL